jgi:bacterioferritin
MTGKFISHLSEIRRRAREHVLEGAVTTGYQADRTKVLALLNEALATELICVLRYKAHYFMARGIQAKPVAEEFAEHAAEEQQHADRIAERITQLGGEPDFNPSELASRSASEYSCGGSLVQMIEENLVAERIAIDTYLEAIGFVEGKDPSTRRMLEEILAVEEEHARELSDLLATLDPTGISPAPLTKNAANDGASS